MRGKVRLFLGAFGLAVLASWFRCAAGCQTLPEQVLRLHVVANSDGEADQAVKRDVRDAVLGTTGEVLAGAETLEEANTALCLHLQAVERAAAGAARGQAVRVEVTEMFFPTREYADFTLPAGRYRTLRVTLGSGQGHNWWCVVFPGLCLPAAADREELDLLGDVQRDIAGHPEQYRVRLKTVEWYEEARDWLRELFVKE